MTLLYMTDDSGNGDFFVYNSETGTLSAYVVVKMAEKTVVVLPPECIPEGTALPDGFAECTIDIGDHTVHGWIWKDSGDSAPEYCVVYGPEADPCKTYPEKLHAHLYRCSRNEHSAADLRNDRGGKCVCMAWTRDALHQFYF